MPFIIAGKSYKRSLSQACKPAPAHAQTHQWRSYVSEWSVQVRVHMERIYFPADVSSVMLACARMLTHASSGSSHVSSANHVACLTFAISQSTASLTLEACLHTTRAGSEVECACAANAWPCERVGGCTFTCLCMPGYRLAVQQRPQRPPAPSMCLGLWERDRCSLPNVADVWCFELVCESVGGQLASTPAVWTRRRPKCSFKRAIYSRNLYFLHCRRDIIP